MKKKELRQKVKQLMAARVMETTLYQDRNWCHVQIELYRDDERYVAHGFSKRNITDKPDRELGYNLARVRAYRQLAQLVPEYTQLQLPKPKISQGMPALLGSAYDKKDRVKLIN